MGSSSMPPLAAAVAATLMVAAMGVAVDSTQWCIARSWASATALQTAIDYACGPGKADCLPIQANGLCYLPNTLQAHASYAFNSYFQRSGGAPGSCDFAGTATVTITDPSYGSCTYPSSSSTAGISTSPNNNSPATTPVTNAPTGSGFGETGETNSSSDGGLTPGFGTPLPNTYNSIATSLRIRLILSTSCFLLLLII